jgi:hypothetical protein
MRRPAQQSNAPDRRPDIQSRPGQVAHAEATAMDLTGQLMNPPETLTRLLSILSRPPRRSKSRS